MSEHEQVWDNSNNIALKLVLIALQLKLRLAQDYVEQIMYLTHFGKEHHSN